MTTTSMKNPMTQQQEANTLVLLSRSNGPGHDKNRHMFECKTCNRQFPSFQALGGHRASHRKPRSAGLEEVQPPPEPAKPRIHECSICGLEFPLGQALGGHMRRHRTNGVLSASNVSKRVDMPGFNLDLNLAPPECEAADTNKDWQQGLDLELQLDLAEKVRFVEWLH